MTRPRAALLLLLCTGLADAALGAAVPEPEVRREMRGRGERNHTTRCSRSFFLLLNLLSFSSHSVRGRRPPPARPGPVRVRPCALPLR